MKKKRLAIIIALAVILVMALAGCSGIKTNKEYFLYGFELEKGSFVQTMQRISFDKETYTIYDNTGAVDNVGEYMTKDDIISFVPDKIGANASRMAATTSMYLHNEYIIDPAFVMMQRQTPTNFEDKSALEGMYNNGWMLKNGKIYQSADGSDVEASFTEEIGDYKINKNKDFVNVTVYDMGLKAILLSFSYLDNFGYEVKALSNQFYSYKEPKLDKMKDALVEMHTTVFENKSSDGGSAEYQLKLMSYPDKNTFNSGVSFSIMGANPSASISGSTLNYTGTGSVRIEYTYGNIKGNSWIYVVDLKLKANLTDSDKTFNVNDVENFEDIISQVAIYDSYPFTYETVEIDSDKVEVKNGKVTFKEAGTVSAKLTVRHVITYSDNSTRTIQKSVNVNLIIA